MTFETLLYHTDGPIATVTLNRPERLNTIVPPMPDEFEDAIRRATLDSAVKVIVLRGAGRSFCAGYDFGGGFHHWDERITTNGRWDPGKDFAWATSAYCPTPAVHEHLAHAEAGDRAGPRLVRRRRQRHGAVRRSVIASEDAQIGTPYSRMWGCYLSGMWLYRLGLTKAKEHALTGRPLSGREAADVRADQRGRAVR